MQGSPSESAVNLLVDGKTLASNVPYATATAYSSLSSGSRHLQIEPSGSSTFIIDETLSLTSGSDSTIVVSNLAPNIMALDLPDDNSAPLSGDFKIRVVNVAPSMGSANVFVVPDGTVLSNVAPTLSRLGVESASGYQSFTAGTYDVFFTIPGTISSFIETGPIVFSAGEIRTMVALDNQAGGFTFTALKDLN